MKKTNIFFYRLIAYRTGYGKDTLQTSGALTESKDEDPSKQLHKDAAVVMEKLKNLKEKNPKIYQEIMGRYLEESKKLKTDIANKSANPQILKNKVEAHNIKFIKEISEKTEIAEIQNQCKDKLMKKVIEVKDKYEKAWKTNKSLFRRHLWQRNITFPQLTYVLTAYLMRWYKVNEQAIDKISSVETANAIKTQVLNESTKYEIWQDYDTINKEILYIFNTWLEGKDEKNRKIYSKRDWDTKYEKATFNGAKFNEKYHWRWAWKRADNGEFAPLPDIYRSANPESLKPEGYYKLDIEAGLHPEEIEAKNLYEKKVGEYLGNLNKYSRSSNINFSLLSISKDLETAKLSFAKAGTNLTGELVWNEKLQNAELIINNQKKSFKSTNLQGIVGEIETVAKKIEKPEAPGATNTPSATPKDAEAVKKLKELSEKGTILDNVKVRKTSKDSKLEISINGKKDGRNLAFSNSIDLGKSFTVPVDMKYGAASLNEKLSNLKAPELMLRNIIPVDLYENLRKAGFDFADLAKKMSPEVTINGTASFDGNYDENLKLADNRARAMEAKVKSQLAGVKIKKVKGEVVDGDGNIVTKDGLAAAWKAELDHYNEELAKQKPITLKEFKSKLSSYDNPQKRTTLSSAEQKHFQDRFQDHRNVNVYVATPETVEFDWSPKTQPLL